MKKQFILLMLLMMTVGLFAEIVILKDGKEISGEIVGKTDDFILFKVGKNIEQINFAIIKSIRNDGNQPITKLWIKHKNFENSSFDLTNIKTSYSKEKNENFVNDKKQYKTKLNWAHFITGVTFGYLAYLNFDNIEDPDKYVEGMEQYMTDSQIDIEKDKIKDINTFYIKHGIIFSVASIINVSYSFEKVEISVSASSAEVSYKF